MDESLIQQARAARTEIRVGRLRGAALVELLRSVPPRERDVFVDEMLGIDAPPPDHELPRGAVPYLPCGVDEILAMAEILGPDDRLVDLGAGLGRVVILGHLVSGARGHGVEIQTQLVERARACTAALDLPVTFEQADITACDLAGSVFFLYAPVNGELLARVIGQLAALARRQRLVVCAVDLELDEPWLRPRPAPTRALAIYDADPGMMA